MNYQLYKIDQKREAIFNQLVENGGELTPEIEKELALTAESSTEIFVDHGLSIVSSLSRIEILTANIERLTALKEAEEKSIKTMKRFIAEGMNHFGVSKIESPLLKISFRASESVEIDDLDSIPAKFMVTKVTTQPDKTAIKAAIKAGELTIGAHIQVNQNLQIR